MTADLDLDLVREAHPDDSGPPSDALESLRQSLLDHIAADSQPVRRRSQRRRRLRVWPATFAGVAGIVLAGGTALAATVVITSGNPFAGPDKPSPAPSAIASIARAYPVLGRAQQAFDIPPIPPGQVLDPYVASQGATLANIRRAVVTSSGESLYLVPADGSVCIISSDNVVQACGQFPPVPDQLVTVGVTICSPNLPTHEIEVASIIPPNVSNVQIHYSDGTSKPATVTNGVLAVYADNSKPLPKSITWTGPKGPERSGTGVPPNAASSRCG